MKRKGGGLCESGGVSEVGTGGVLFSGTTRRKDGIRGAPERLDVSLLVKGTSAESGERHSLVSDL